MSPLFRLCRALESVVGLTAIRAQWQLELDVATEWKDLLRPTTQLATVYPKLDSNPASPRAYRVVYHDEGDVIGVCPDGTGNIKLTVNDLVVYELDVAGLGERLGTALGIVCDVQEVEVLTQVYQLGVHAPANGSETTVVYLAITAEPHVLTRVIERLSACQDRRFLLLTPTRRAWRAWSEPLTKRGTVAAISESFVITAGRELALTSAGATLLAEPDTRAAAKSEIAARDPAMTTETSPPSEPYVPDRDEAVVLTILSAAKRAMIQEEIAEATAATDRPIARKTVGTLLASLVRAGLVDYRPRSRKGVRITPQGATWAAAANACAPLNAH